MEQSSSLSDSKILQRMQRIRQRRTLDRVSGVLLSDTEVFLGFCQDKQAWEHGSGADYEHAPVYWKDFENWRDVQIMQASSHKQL